MGVDTIFRRVLAENPATVRYHRDVCLLIDDIIEVLEDKEASTDDLKNVLAGIGAALYDAQLIDRLDDPRNPVGIEVSTEDLRAYEYRRPVPVVPAPEHPFITLAKENAQDLGWLGFRDDCLAAAERFKEYGSDDMVTTDDDEPSLYRAHAFVGSYAATPSGKVYAPFATSNLTPCPECGGTGVVAPRTPRELFLCREMIQVMKQRPATPNSLSFETVEWAEWVARHNALVQQGTRDEGDLSLDCPLCEDGYHEPALDAAWREECEVQAAALGDGFYFDEVDGDYYLVLPIVHEDGECEE